MPWGIEAAEPPHLCGLAWLLGATSLNVACALIEKGHRLGRP